MSVSWRLPDWLGGFECELVGRGGFRPPADMTWVDVVGHGGRRCRQLMFKSTLVENAERPPQPPPGSVVRIERLRPGAQAPAGMAFPALFWRRPDHGDADWTHLASGYDFDWSTLTEIGDPAVLVPDSAEVGGSR